LLDKGEFRYALIEGCSALQIALDEYVRKKCDGPLKNQVFNDKFENMHAVGKMALIAYMVPAIARDDIETTAKAIEIRNKIIHDGDEVPSDASKMILAVMRVVSQLLDGPCFKFPKLDGKNTLLPPEESTGA
jgi:hypothetical protein